MAGLGMLKTLSLLMAGTVGCSAAEPPRVERRAARAAATKKKAARPRLGLPPGWTWPPNAQMKAEGKACLARIDALGVEWNAGPATPRIATPIVLPAMEIGGIKLTSMWRDGPFAMDCYLALAFADGGAAALRDAGVVELRFSGIHSYRKVAGTKVLSRHALGLAIDVFEMVDRDGNKHVVNTDYLD